MIQNKIRIVIADPNPATTKKLASYLQDSGFEVYCLHEGLSMGQKILEIKPHFIIIDMTMPDFPALKCLQLLQEKNLLADGELRVFVVSQHNAKQNVEVCLKNGAHDYIVKPINPMDLLTRIALHLQSRKRMQEEAQFKSLEIKQANYYLDLAGLLIKTISVRTSPHQIHFQLLRMVSMALGAVRVSLIKLGDAPTVIASSDNDKFTQFPLQIQKYPEIDYVQRTEKALFIESIKDDAMMNFIKDQMKSIYFNSMIVLPIFSDGHLHGILSARLTESANLNEADIKLCQIAAQTIGSYWQLQLSKNTRSVA
jgi:DNA-binding response OmpR family regulator